MILALGLGFLIVFFVLRRIRRSRALFDIQARPYRYPPEVRRSRHSYRGGF